MARLQSVVAADLEVAASDHIQIHSADRQRQDLSRSDVFLCTVQLKCALILLNERTNHCGLVYIAWSGVSLRVPVSKASFGQGNTRSGLEHKSQRYPRKMTNAMLLGISEMESCVS